MGGDIGGLTANGWHVFTINLTPAAVAANTTVEQTFASLSLPAAVGRLAGMDGVHPELVSVDVSKPTAQAGLGIVGTRLVDLNTLAITFVNVTAGALTPTGGETYLVGLQW